MKSFEETVFEIIKEYDHKVFYKYIDINGGIKMLENKTLKMSKATNFNDPFDLYEELLDIDDCQSYTKNITNKYKESFNRKQRREILNKSVSEKKRHIKDMFGFIKNEIGICSLSADYDEILMWSHYANMHKGICVGVELDFLSLLKKGIFFFPIVYVDNFEMKYFGATEEEKRFALYNWTKTKYKKWEYENEFRLVGFDFNLKNQTEFLQIDDTIIKEIYLGSKISKENKLTIKDLIKSYEITPKLFDIKLKKENFKLIAKQI